MSIKSILLHLLLNSFKPSRHIPIWIGISLEGLKRMLFHNGNSKEKLTTHEMIILLKKWNIVSYNKSLM